MISLRKMTVCLLLACLLIVLQIFFLASCGKNRADDSDTSEASDSGSDKIDSGNNNQQTDSSDKGQSDEKILVRFLTDDGIPVSIEECAKGDTLIPPTPPRKIGYVFTGWDGNYTNVSQNTDITAKYTDVSKIKNAIVADTVYASSNTELEVLVGIYGEVDFCGLDMDIKYDGSLLDYVGADNVDGCVILNGSNKGVVHMNYVTTSDTTGEVAFMTLKFKAKANTKAETSLQIKVNGMYSLDSNDNLIKSEYQVLANNIIIGEKNNEQ